MGDFQVGQLQKQQPPLKRWQQTFKLWYNKLIITIYLWIIFTPYESDHTKSRR